MTSLSGVTAAPALFRSDWFGAALADGETLTEICLAASAAPTYFPAHRVGTRKEPMLDGGLVANSPDLLLLLEVLRARPNAWGTIEMLSIGTAGVGSGGMAGELPQRGFGWALQVVPLMMSTQERLAEEQVRALLGSGYLRINHSPQPNQRALAEMDAVDESMSDTLLSLADAAFKAARSTHAAALQRILR